jgi:hypothetical protein
MKAQDASLAWWGEYNLEDGSCQKWVIGPLELIVCRVNREWQLSHLRHDEPTFDDDVWHTEQVSDIAQIHDEIYRYVFKDTSGRLTIAPMLADRAVISRPTAPFSLVAGEEVTLYVSTPIWISVAVGDSQKVLDEIGIQRPSDTWFGPSTLEGELCYASATHCRLSLHELPQRTYRAITPVHIRNHAQSALSVERLMVPTTMLSLYTTAQGQLWTPKIVLTRAEDGEMADLKIDKSTPQEAGELVQVSKPRNNGSEGVLVRAFNAVFH